MKTLILIFSVLSLCLLVYFPVMLSQKPSSPSTLGASSSSSYEGSYQRQWEHYESERDSWTQMASWPSMAYFAGAVILFIALARPTMASGKWKKGMLTMAFLALAMLIWSSLLSGAIGFDEVFPAWVVAILVFGIAAFKNRNLNSRQQAVQGDQNTGGNGS